MGRPEDDVEPALSKLDPWPLLDSLTDVVVVAGPDNTIRYVNVAVERLLGWTPAELVGRPLPELMPHRWRGQHTAAFLDYFQRGRPRLMDQLLRLPALRRDGTEADVELQLDEVQGPSGETLVIGMLRQIASRVELERQSELATSLVGVLAEAGDLDTAVPKVLEALAVNLGWDLAMLWLVDEDGATLTQVGAWHDPAADFPALAATSAGRSYPPGSSLPGRVFANPTPVWVPDVVGDPGFTRAPEAASDGLHAAVAFPITAHDRVIGVAELFSVEVRPPDPAMVEVMASFGPELGTFVDRRRAESARRALLDELRFTEALLRVQGEAGREGLLAVSPDGRILSSNRRLLELFGIDEGLVRPGEPVAELVASIGPVDDDRLFAAPMQGVYDEPRSPSRDEIVMRDGRVIDRFGAPLVHESGNSFGWAWYFRDITEEKQAEQRLFESGERFAAVARTLQESLLPPDLPEVQGVELAARYHPAGGGLEVGGDFYDVFRTGRSTWGIVMGDVCGKGAAAARLTALARYTLRAAAMHVRTSSQALAVLNQAMLRQAATEQERDPERFLTAVFASLRRARNRVVLTLSCAGHPPPLVVRSDHRIERVGVPGTLLGLLDEVDLEDATVALAPGDTVVFFTDGVTEARGESGQLDEEGLVGLLAGCAGASAKDIAEQVERGALQRQHGEPRDDIAVLVVQVAR